ncbi:MAG: hypothetical protein ACRCVP_13340 [Shewanella xiamenensis]
MKNYCIYTDSQTDDPSPEHIIPLSLGGHNDFSISVDRKFNNDIGSKVDGKFSSDFLVLFERDRAGAKGYSGKHPKPVVKNAILDDGRPVQAIFGNDGLKIFDLKNKTMLPDSESKGRTIDCRNITIDIDIDLMFVAKVALSSGYFVYGDVFQECVETDEFRKIMNLDKKNLPKDSRARVYSRFHDPETEDEMFHILKIMTEMCGCSSVIIVPSVASFGVAVSVLGKFVGFISVPCDSSKLPNEEMYKYGHCVYLQNNEVKRCSFDHARLKLLDLISDNNPLKGDGDKAAAL